MATIEPLLPRVQRYVDDVREHVEEIQDWAFKNAQATQAVAVQNLAEIGNSFRGLRFTRSPAPDAPEVGNIAPIEGRLPDLTLETFGTVSAIARALPADTAVPDIPVPAIQSFEPNFSGINIPDAPDARDPGPLPVAPALMEPTLPTAPVLVKPNLPEMADVNIPTFTFDPLPTFDASAPTFEGTAVQTVMQWAEKPYKPVILDEEMARLRRMWDGELGLPPDVERALWERAVSREDLAAARDISAAAVEFAGRGFTLPPGALVNRIDTIRDEAALRKAGLQREVMIKIADTQIENLRFACQQAIASENVLVGVWSQMAERSFNAAKVQMDASMALYNAQIALFNARQSAYATEATVFRARLDGWLASIQVFKAQVDAEIAKGQVNEQRVRVYTAQVQALTADIDVYKAQMQGAQVQADIQKTRIEAYRAQVQGYAEQLQADKVRFDAYESRVKGETAKGGLLESQTRAYVAYVQGKGAVVDAHAKNQAAAMQKAELRLRAFTAQLENDRNVIQAQQASISAAADAYRARTAQFAAEAQANASFTEVQVRAQEANIRNSIALHEVEVRKYIADMEQMIREASLQIEAMKSIAQANATLAAGAMAGISVQSSISAQGHMTTSGSLQESWQHSAEPVIT